MYEYVTYDAIAKIYTVIRIQFSQIEGNERNFSHTQ